jgi:Protein of unknown function (DUF1257)
MSCSVECIVIMYTVPKLLTVIQTISAAALEAGAMQETITVREEEDEIVDCVGKRIPVDLVLENAQGDRIGVKASQDGRTPLEFVFRDEQSATARQTIDRIRQAYARLQVIDQLKKKGYQQVKEERLPNGSIRLVVQKWR